MKAVILLLFLVVPCHLAVIDGMVRIESSHFPGFFVGFGDKELINTSSSPLDLLNTFPNNKTTWNVVKDPCDALKYNFESMLYPGYYMSAKGNALVLSKFTNSTKFKASSCFKIGSNVETPDNALTLSLDEKAICSDNKKKLSLDCTNNSLTRHWFWRYNGLIETKGNCEKANEQWSEWSLWSLCSTSCGTKGKTTRQRKCIATVPDYERTNNNCLIELDVQEKSCNVKECPVIGRYYDNDYWICFFKFRAVDGKWSALTSESSCNNCDGGMKYTTRKCNSPKPKDCGSMCGEASFNAVICPIHGNWTEWSSWSTCTVNCGPGGRQYRSRNCTNPNPTYGGNRCEGESNVSTSCNSIACPKTLTLQDFDSFGGTESEGVISISIQNGYIQSKIPYQRPIIIEAEMRSKKQTQGIYMTFGDVGRDIQITVELGAYWRFNPGGGRGEIGSVTSFRKVKFELDAGTKVKFYIDGDLKFTTNSNLIGGYLKFVRETIDMEVRSIKINSS